MLVFDDMVRAAQDRKTCLPKVKRFSFGQQSSYVKIIKCPFDKRIEASPQLCEIKRGLFRSLITRNTSHSKYL